MPRLAATIQAIGRRRMPPVWFSLLAIVTVASAVSAVALLAAGVLFGGSTETTAQPAAVSGVGGHEAVVMLDWDAGTADWENITDETVVGEVQLRDPVTLETFATLGTGYDPQIALSDDGTRLFVAETVSVDQAPVDQVRVLDMTDGFTEIVTFTLPDRLLSTADVSPGVLAPSSDGRYLFAQKYEGNRYWLDAYYIEAEGTQAGSIDLPAYCGVASILPVTESTIAVTCPGPAHSAVIADPIAGTATTIELPGGAGFINGVPAGGSSSQIASAVLSADGASLYVISQDGAISVIDVGTREVLTSQQLDLGGGRLPYGHAELKVGSLYVGSSPDVFSGRSNEIRVFDEVFGLARVIHSPVFFSSLAISDDGSLAYVVDRQEGLAAVIDIDSGEQIELVEDVGKVPDFIGLR